MHFKKLCFPCWNIECQIFITFLPFKVFVIIISPWLYTFDLLLAVCIWHCLIVNSYPYGCSISLNLLLVFVSMCYRYLSTYGFIFSSLLLHHFPQLVVGTCLNRLMVFVLSWIYIFILLVAVFPSICCRYLSTHGFIFSSLLLHHFPQLVVGMCLKVLMVFVSLWIYIFILLVAVFPSICCQYLSP